MPCLACPVCRRKLNGAYAQGFRTPKPGDLTICVKCGAFCRFGAQTPALKLNDPNLAAGDARTAIQGAKRLILATIQREAPASGWISMAQVMDSEKGLEFFTEHHLTIARRQLISDEAIEAKGNSSATVYRLTGKWVAAAEEKMEIQTPQEETEETTIATWRRMIEDRKKLIDAEQMALNIFTAFAETVEEANPLVKDKIRELFSQTEW